VSSPSVCLGGGSCLNGGDDAASQASNPGQMATRVRGGARGGVQATQYGVSSASREKWGAGVEWGVVRASSSRAEGPVGDFKTGRDDGHCGDDGTARRRRPRSRGVGVPKWAVRATDSRGPRSF
jgi:hypothetical protein